MFSCERRSNMLMCLFCRHEWSEQKVEAMVAAEGDIATLTGTHVSSGAFDIADAAVGCSR